MTKDVFGAKLTCIPAQFETGSRLAGKRSPTRCMTKDVFGAKLTCIPAQFETGSRLAGKRSPTRAFSVNACRSLHVAVFASVDGMIVSL
jgi:hypothetical protein